MKIFGHPMSTCTRKVLTVLAEKQHKADFVLVDIMKGEGKTPENLQRQPFGQVPALEDDGFHLYESRAIIRYLDAKLPGVKLSPEDAKGRAILEQWISVESANFTPHAMKIIYQLMFAPMRGQKPDEKLVEEGKAGVARCADVMEAQLAKTKFIAGDSFSLADIGFMPYIEYLAAVNAAEGITSRPHVAKWWDAIRDRRSWQIAIGKATA